MVEKIILLAGGIGGAKLAEAYERLGTIDLVVVPNIGDDDEFHGLWVSPDVDTILYTLSDRVNRENGWGVKGESLNALGILKELGQETWMTLGDKDLGLHIYRTGEIRRGVPKTEITEKIANIFGITSKVFLPTDGTVQTKIHTESGTMSFQEYFVKNRCSPEVRSVSYSNSDTAIINPKVLNAIENSDLILIAPSNPVLSIKPILSISPIHSELIKHREKVCIVSPIIGGKAIKGPTIQIMNSMGLEPTCLGVAKYYTGIANTIVCDTLDKHLEGDIKKFIPDVIFTSILMNTLEDKKRLAKEVMNIF